MVTRRSGRSISAHFGRNLRTEAGREARLAEDEEDADAEASAVEKRKSASASGELDAMGLSLSLAGASTTGGKMRLWASFL